MSDQRPNILFINTDQQSLDTIARLGCNHAETPALDKLTQQGTCFLQSYTPNPVCLPARASWFTGRMPSETGITRPRPEGNGPRPGIRKDIPTLGAWLRDKGGYETIYAGKWHVPEYITTRHDQIPGFYTITTGINDQGFIMDPNVAMACDAWLRNRTEKDPFFLVASFMNPHDICEWLFQNTADRNDLPYPELADVLPELPANFDIPEGEPPALPQFRNTMDNEVGYWGEQQWRYYLWSYYRHVEAIDAEVGRILQAVEDTGRDQDTLVIFTSDHGEGLGAQQMTHKSFPYDSVCRVPLIFRLPGVVQEDRVDSQTLVSGLDLFPTICDVAGVPHPENLRGVSLLPTLQDRGKPERAFVPVEVSRNGRVIRTERHKYIRYVGDEPQEMFFDLASDPGETRNLALDPASADLIREHRTILENWEATLDPSVELDDAR